MLQRDIVVIGASAGGIDALSEIVQHLPEDFPASIFVVVHVSPDSPGYLPAILARRGRLAAHHALDGQAFKHGQIYVAPPDRHLLLKPDGHMRVTHGPKENRSRPAIDPLFRSAALAFNGRVIGVVLSGALDDGTNGLRNVKMCGGVAVVQDPQDALVDSMPMSALRNVSVDYRRRAADIGPLLAELVKEVPDPRAGLDSAMKEKLQMEVDIATHGTRGESPTRLGEPSLFTCPECSGTLMQLRDERPYRYRCHTGHAFTADSLLAELTEKTEQSIWSTVRAIQESSMLMRHLADHWRDLDPKMARELLEKARAAEERAELIRKAADAHEVLSEEKLED